MTERNKKVVGACIIVDENDRILLLLRAATDPWKPGWWDLPGGHLDEDETPLEGATRETLEEAGLVVSRLQKVEARPMGRIIKYFFVTRSYEGSVSLNPNPDTGIIEHDEYKWMTLEEIEAIDKSIVPPSIAREALSLV